MEIFTGLIVEIRQARPGGGLFDLITELPPDTDLEPWDRAGWARAVIFFGLQPTETEVRARDRRRPGLTRPAPPSRTWW